MGKDFRIGFMILATLLNLVVADSECVKTVQTTHDDKIILEHFGNLDAVQLKEYSTDLECLNVMVRSNYFESAKFMLQTQFGNVDEYDQDTGKLLSKMQSVVQSAIQYVKNQQDEVMQIFESTQQLSQYSDSIPVISPSLRWAQSTDNTMIEVKFATRFDSPACLDIYDDVVTLVNRTLSISAMCRNDKKLLKYQLSIELYDDVRPFTLSEEEKNDQQAKIAEYEAALEQFKLDYETYQKAQFHEYDKYSNTTDKDSNETAEDQKEEETTTEESKLVEPTAPEQPVLIEPSYFNMQSVGRLYLNLTKVDGPKRWRRLLAQEFGVKKSNMQVWWELHEKYEEELVKLEVFEGDDEEVLDKAGVESPKKQKKSAGKKKSKKGKKKQQGEPDKKEDL